ncbi:UDP-glucose 4-epimerase GalE [Microbacterium sp. ET2]|uniref:UDP-glucose 4-epimerase GalE n=1 Tax=Microbacterium albipurpureum TaxID=3050384 RepID=UPI00259C8344|nr:UDP-glucose 4-epimerase GalE [Microbacterium sp. ET2 (Ac-2212)]WJL95110.1 UDP-glucose 4-epimerase GalE [Microbacterium sp. ET2 (Ac-2212)]
MRVLLSGGAGYIGVHTAIALLEAGHEVVVVDDMSNSSLEALVRAGEITGAGIPLLVSDIRDEARVRTFVSENAPLDAVIHFAGLKAVGESVADPLRYYDVNIGSAVAVLKLMAAESIPTVVFSSSATVYGQPERLPLVEDSPTGLDLPNPYGKTKRIVEEILADAAAAGPGVRAVALRYFNPVGAHPSGRVGEDPVGVPTNLMPYVARVAVGELERVGIFGDDYPTPDGTGLRDYIHVMDLAAGHVAALENARPGYEVFNLGTGVPISVRQLIAAFGRAARREIPSTVLPRRAGDVAASYCDPAKAWNRWGWRAERSIDDACADAWRWQSRNPQGYRTP